MYLGYVNVTKIAYYLTLSCNWNRR